MFQMDGRDSINELNSIRRDWMHTRAKPPPQRTADIVRYTRSQAWFAMQMRHIPAHNTRSHTHDTQPPPPIHTTHNHTHHIPPHIQTINTKQRPHTHTLARLMSRNTRAMRNTRMTFTPTPVFTNSPMIDTTATTKSNLFQSSNRYLHDSTQNPEWRHHTSKCTHMTLALVKHMCSTHNTRAQKVNPTDVAHTHSEAELGTYNRRPNAIIFINASTAKIITNAVLKPDRTSVHLPSHTTHSRTPARISSLHPNNAGMRQGLAVSHHGSSTPKRARGRAWLISWIRNPTQIVKTQTTAR